MKYIFFSIILCAILEACTTTNFVSVDVLKPADATLFEKAKGKKILIVDNAVISTKDRILLKDYVEVLEDSVRSIITNSLCQFMNEEQNFSSIRVLPEKLNKTNKLNAPLSLPRVKILCADQDADIIISLDSIKIGYRTKYEFDVYNEYNISDYVRLSGYITGVLSVYDNSGMQLGNSIPFIEALDQKIGFGFDPQEYQKEETSKLISELSVLTADKITGIFIPSWNTQDRYFYSNQSTEMEKAANYIADGKWDVAADIWQKQYEKESNKIKKSQLAFNIALAKECVDNIEEASRWIDKAVSILSATQNSKLLDEVVNYQKVLDERKSNTSILSRQFESLK